MKPLIGMTARIYDDKKLFHSLRAVYSNAVRAAGGIPILIPMPVAEDFEQYISALDGLLITGGGDINPLLFGEEPHPTVTKAERDLDLSEMKLVRMFHAARKPVMGICRGCQVINVAFGGTLYQDLPSQTGSRICHNQHPDHRAEAIHSICMEKDSLLCTILGKERTEVNSLHHQSVKEPGHGLRVVAKAADGIVEAIEDAEGLLLGYQWHPEEMCATGEDAWRLFKHFVGRCRESSCEE